MSIVDEIRSLNMKPGPLCGWRRLIDSVSAEEAKELNGALMSNDITYGAIVRWLKEKKNIRMSEGVLGHHKRGGCTCQR
jgi:hypothetical protein